MPRPWNFCNLRLYPIEISLIEVALFILSIWSLSMICMHKAGGCFEGLKACLVHTLATLLDLG